MRLKSLSLLEFTLNRWPPFHIRKRNHAEEKDIQCCVAVPEAGKGKKKLHDARIVIELRDCEMNFPFDLSTQLDSLALLDNGYKQTVS